jgi:hypothetical protein
VATKFGRADGRAGSIARKGSVALKIAAMPDEVTQHPTSPSKP